MDKEITLSQIGCDVKAEVVAANMVENIDYPLDKISINNKGSKQRKYRKDIVGVETRTTKLGNEDWLYLDVSRNGIYDMLPAGFFHSDMKRGKRGTTEVIDEFKRNREEEEADRLFFHPIERELNRIRILLEMNERQTIFSLMGKYKDALFFRLFPELEDIDQVYWPAMIQVLPMVNKIRGNIELIALLCDFLFNVPAKPVAVRQFTTVKNPNGLNKLGRVHVGENFILGNDIPDYSPEFEIEIGPINKGDALKFLPGGEFDRLFTFIKKYLIPFDSSLKFTLLFPNNQKGLYLCVDGSTDRIGLNTYL